MGRKERTLWAVNSILDKRYGCGETLYELFLDHECIRTLEALISYGPEETGGDDSSTWLEYKRLTRNFLIDLEAGAFGAYSNFIDQAESLGIDASKAWDLFADASSYWGTDLQAYEQLERGAEAGALFEERGRQFLTKLRVGAR